MTGLQVEKIECYFANVKDSVGLLIVWCQMAECSRIFEFDLDLLLLGGTVDSLPAAYFCIARAPVQRAQSFFHPSSSWQGAHSH